MRFYALTLGVGGRFHQTVTIMLLAGFLAFPGFCGDFAKDRLTIGPHAFKVELAVTREEQERGLMFREWLDADHGMLFILPQPRVMTMWMKNTLIPLDMLFIDEKGRIIFIAADTTPRSEALITSPAPVKAVLELPGGTCEKRGIHVGDIVSHATFAARTVR